MRDAVCADEMQGTISHVVWRELWMEASCHARYIIVYFSTE